VKPGKHDVVLTFKPKSVNTTETIAYVSYIILIMVVLCAAFMEYRRRQKKS
jgi:hypothetical protein